MQGGIISLTKALAIDEAKHGVRVNAYVYFLNSNLRVLSQMLMDKSISKA
jgi:hypothetical protein